jgi:hypothetical protein
MAVKKTGNSKGESNVAQQSAVINPYALAELLAGRRIDWKAVKDRPQLLESILQTPYQELFDPRFGGPLYTGLRLNKNLQLERVRSPMLDDQPKREDNNFGASDQLGNNRGTSRSKRLCSRRTSRASVS